MAEHKDEAFTEEDLRQHYSPALLESLSDGEKRLLQATKQEPFYFLGERGAFGLALEKFLEIREAEKRIIRGTEYYAYREVLPF